MRELLIDQVRNFRGLLDIGLLDIAARIAEEGSELTRFYMYQHLNREFAAMLEVEIDRVAAGDPTCSDHAFVILLKEKHSDPVLFYKNLRKLGSRGDGSSSCGKSGR